MIKKLVLGAMVGGLCLSTTLQAAERPDFNQGVKKVTAFGNLTNTSVGDFDQSMLLLGANFSKVNKSLEVGGGIQLVATDSGVSDSTSMYWSGFANHHFLKNVNSTTVPYVGAGLSYLTQSAGDTDTSGLGFEIHAGANFFQTENISFSLELYLSQFSMSADAGGDFDQDETGIRLGFSFWK